MHYFCNPRIPALIYYQVFFTALGIRADYTAPPNFHSGRAIVCVGEVRLSSNYVAGAAVQAHKLVAVDVGVSVINRRLPYHVENYGLCRDHSLFASGFGEEATVLLASLRRCSSREEALLLLGFVECVRLDTAEAFVRTAASPASGSATPRVACSLTMGQLYLNTCQDSFSCLTTTAGEWWVYFSSPCVEDVEAAEAAAAAASVSASGAGPKLAGLSGRGDGAPVAPPPGAPPNPNIDPGGTPMSLLDVIDGDMFSGGRAPDATGGGWAPGNSSVGPHPFRDVPDSELSAAELRQKHGIGSDTTNSQMAKSLLIKNFYTIEASSSMQDLAEGGRAGGAARERVPPDDASDGTDADSDAWETVDHEFIARADFPGNSDTLASWFSTGIAPPRPGAKKTPEASNFPLQIFPNHIPIPSSAMDLEEGDMDAATLAGTLEAPGVNARVLINNLTVICRFYCGNDWVDPVTREPINGINRETERTTNKKSESLLEALLEEEFLEGESRTFVPPSAGASGGTGTVSGRKKEYFELSLRGLRLRNDSFVESQKHRLASCTYLEADDAYLSETIDYQHPQKMLGEWINNMKHPRDPNDGILMMKMVSMFPENRISVDGKLVSMESRVALHLLPLRCHINQSVLKNICSFFSPQEPNSEDGNEKKQDPVNNNVDESCEKSKVELPQEDQGAFFQTFHVKSCKLKVNYTPTKLDAASLRAGSYSELLNLFPLEDIELLLQPLTLTNISGWGAAIGETLRSWLGDIVSTQVHKFIRGAPGVSSISQIGSGAYDLVMMPVQQYKRERKFGRGLKKGTSKFVGTVALETLNVSHKMTKGVANFLNRVVSSEDYDGALPRRPEQVPKNIRSTSQHSRASVSKSFRAVRETIITIPRREYRRHGTTGAIRCVIKNVPVAVLAPISGATEALSYTVLGVRNQMRPDIMKEDEYRHVYKNR